MEPILNNNSFQLSFEQKLNMQFIFCFRRQFTEAVITGSRLTKEKEAQRSLSVKVHPADHDQKLTQSSNPPTRCLNLLTCRCQLLIALKTSSN